jgi:ribonuclease J
MIREKDGRKCNITQNLKICTLSGVEEVGKNCTFVEYCNEILIVDLGFSFPELEPYGIDYLIPNFSYLKKNKHKIKGVLITHGHLDHTGALSYILPEIGFPPVYAGRFANALIKERLKEFDLDKKVKLIDVKRNEPFRINNFQITFVGVTHSIPDSHSIFIESRKGNILFSGDYKIDRAPANEPETSYEKFGEIGNRVDVALMESTNSFEEGKTKTETEISENLEEIICNTKGRVVVASFSSLVSRIYSVFKIAEKTDRKVVLMGRSIRNIVKIAREQRYIDVNDRMIVEEKHMKKYPDNQLLFVSTGSQGERYAALNRISLNEHKTFKIKKGDLIIMSASEIPGNAIKIQNMTDRLIKQGADVLKANMEAIYESGHGFQGDMKIMFDMIKPKYIIPIHGNMTLRYQNKRNLMKWGFEAERIPLTENGQIWEFDGENLKRGIKIESKPILIDGLGVGDIGDIVLKDRKQLAEYGMFIVLMNLSSKESKLIGKPKFISRGFVYMRTSKELLKEIEKKVVEIHDTWHKRSKNRNEKNDLKDELEKNLKKFLYKKTEREPVIIIAII